MSDKFASILDQQVEEIEAPKPVPEGDYRGTVKGAPVFGELPNEKKTPYAEYTIVLTEPINDSVAQEDLDAVGGLEGKKYKFKLFLTEDSLHRVKKFVEEHVKIDGLGKTLRQALSEVPNNDVGVKIKHRINEKDPDEIFAFIDRTFAIE